ncbi:MAG: hypothetical protein HY714_03990 [Candidatus Omnitrophica bacterium]|nr:hypothetical protein [Candidatus Omnitrophota bacterium]
MSPLFDSVQKAGASVRRLWMAFARGVGRANTLILLTVIYAVVFGAARGIAWLLRKDMLDGRWKDRASYWRRRTDFKTDRADYLKPY